MGEGEGGGDAMERGWGVRRTKGAGRGVCAGARGDGFDATRIGRRGGGGGRGAPGTATGARSRPRRRPGCAVASAIPPTTSGGPSCPRGLENGARVGGGARRAPESESRCHFRPSCSREPAGAIIRLMNIDGAAPPDAPNCCDHARCGKPTIIICPAPRTSEGTSRVDTPPAFSAAVPRGRARRSVARGAARGRARAPSDALTPARVSFFSRARESASSELARRPARVDSHESFASRAPPPAACRDEGG